MMDYQSSKLWAMELQCSSKAKLYSRWWDSFHLCQTSSYWKSSGIVREMQSLQTLSLHNTAENASVFTILYVCPTEDCSQYRQQIRKSITDASAPLPG